MYGDFPHYEELNVDFVTVDQCIKFKTANDIDKNQVAKTLYTSVVKTSFNIL